MEGDWGSPGFLTIHTQSVFKFPVLHALGPQGRGRVLIRGFHIRPRMLVFISIRVENKNIYIYIYQQKIKTTN